MAEFINHMQLFDFIELSVRHLIVHAYFYLFMSLYANRDMSYMTGKPATAIINFSSILLGN